MTSVLFFSQGYLDSLGYIIGDQDWLTRMPGLCFSVMTCTCCITCTTVSLRLSFPSLVMTFDHLHGDLLKSRVEMPNTVVTEEQKLTIISLIEIIKIIQFENIDFSRKTKEGGTSPFFSYQHLTGFSRDLGHWVGNRKKKMSVFTYRIPQVKTDSDVLYSSPQVRGDFLHQSVKSTEKS